MTDSKTGITVMQQIQNYINTYLMLSIGNYIMSIIRQSMKNPTKKDLEAQILFLESKIITKTLEQNGEVIFP